MRNNLRIMRNTLALSLNSRDPKVLAGRDSCSAGQMVVPIRTGAASADHAVQFATGAIVFGCRWPVAEAPGRDPDLLQGRNTIAVVSRVKPSFREDSWTDTGIAAGLATVWRQDYLFRGLRLYGARRGACPQRCRFAGHRQCRSGRIGTRSATSREAAGQGSEYHLLLGSGIPDQGCGGRPFSGGGTPRPQAVRERRQA